MDSSTKYGNAVDFDTDLHSIYAAYLGQFEAAGQEWWDKSWGGYFATFNDFLGFGWEVMVVVDGRTGRAHIAVRREQIALFAKMIRTRFGESLAKEPPTTLPLAPVPTRTLSLRRLIQLPDLAAYRKLSLTLPAAELSHLRHRARTGDVGVAEQLFYAGGPSTERETGGGAVGMRDNGVGYTFAAVRTTWWEKGGAATGLVPGIGRTQGGRAGQAAGGSGLQGKGLVLEVGTAVVRCANLRAVDVWPPTPSENYRKSHFIAEEWVDKRTNQNPSTYPRAYAFGKSQFIPDKDIERILDANLAALASQENDSNANTLVLLSLGEPSPIPLPASSTLPGNILHIGVLALEYNLLRRAQEQGVPGTPDRHGPLTSLSALLQTLQIPSPPFAPVGNAGNEAYYILLAFQKLMMAQTRLPDVLFKAPESFMSPTMSPYTGAPAGMYNSFPSSGSMQFPTYPSMMPPPQAPFARPPHTRRESSSSSRRQSELFQPPVRTKSPASMNSPSRHQKSLHNPNDDARPRPASFGDMGPSGQFRNGGHANGSGDRSSPASQVDLPASGSAPNSVRVPGRGPMPRSSTIFWDDAEYADADTSSQKGSLRDLTRLRQTQTGPADGSEREKYDLTMRGRSHPPPPSAMRYNSANQVPLSNSNPGSRIVSWSEDRRADNSSPNGYHGNGGGGVDRDRSVDRRSVMNGSSTGIAQLGECHVTVSKGRPVSQMRGNGGGKGSGSSTMIDSHSGSEGKEGTGRVMVGGGGKSKIDDDGKGSKIVQIAGEAKEKFKEKEKQPKLKSEKSMKNVAGALARFWVG